MARVRTNAETEGRYHSNWLSMMYPRLKLARNLLTNDGVMFISIDDHELDNLTKLANEIFGESNHVTTFVWKNKTGGGNDAKDVTSEHEYCLLYARDIGLVTKLVTNVDNADTYTLTDEHESVRGRHKIEALYRSSLQYSASLFYPITAPDGTEILPNDSNPSSTKHIWRWSRGTYAQKLAEGRVAFRRTANGWRVFSKQYLLQDDNGQPRTKGVRTVLDFVGSRRGTEEVKSLFGGRKVFDYPKPVEYLKYYIRATTRDDDIILDFFAGSGSSAHATMVANIEDGARRSFILVQLPQPLGDGGDSNDGFDSVADLSRRRIELAGEELRGRPSELSPHRKSDVGFRSYRLTDTNFSKWHVSDEFEYNSLEQHLFMLRHNTSDDATPDAMLTELLLKKGYSLSERIFPTEISELQVHAVYDGDEEPSLLAYLNTSSSPSMEQLRAIVDTGVTRLIILDDAFKGDDELKSNLAQLCKSKDVELWTA